MNGISLLSDTNPLIYLLAGNSEVADFLNNVFLTEINPQIKTITKDLLQKYPVRLPDAIIAATALYLDLPLFTADVEFKKIPELKLILLEF